MALLFMEGFDTFDTVTKMYTDQFINGDTSLVTLVSGRIDGQALRNANAGSDVFFHFDASSATVYIGMAIKLDSPIAVTNVIMDFGNQFGIAINTANQMSIRRMPSTTLGGILTPLSIDVWHFLEIKVFINNSTGTVLVKLDGVEEVNLTSQDTLNTAAFIDYYKNIGNLSGIIIDDLYIGDDTGLDMTDLQGDCHIEVLDPDGDGATTDWTPLSSTNISNVDEGATNSDEDTTYNSSSTATHKDLFTMANIAGNVDTVLAVQAMIRARKVDAGSRVINATIRSNVTEVDGADQGLSIDYMWKREIYENDPDGGGAWDETAVNAMQVGVELKT